MPNKNYLKGRNAEYLAMDQLKKNGWTVFRQAGSHSCADIIAIDINMVKLIQVKSCKTKTCKMETVPRHLVKEMKAFQAIPCPINVKKELWMKLPNTSEFKVIRLYE